MTSNSTGSISIEAYQHTLTEQIKNAADTETSPTVLGVAVGEERYLIPMNEVSEVIQIPKLARVPLTQPWFLGLANVRGNLYGVTDLAVYLGSHQMPFTLKSRILLVSAGNKIYGGFIVHSMLGIRNLSEFVPVQSAKKKQVKVMSNRQYKDSEDRLWRELSLLQLMREEKFLQIARE